MLRIDQVSHSRRAGPTGASDWIPARHRRHLAERSLIVNRGLGTRPDCTMIKIFS